MAQSCVILAYVIKLKSLKEACISFGHNQHKNQGVEIKKLDLIKLFDPINVSSQYLGS